MVLQSTETHYRGAVLEILRHELKYAEANGYVLPGEADAKASKILDNLSVGLSIYRDPETLAGPSPHIAAAAAFGEFLREIDIEADIISASVCLSAAIKLLHHELYALPKMTNGERMLFEVTGRLIDDIWTTPVGLAVAEFLSSNIAPPPVYPFLADFDTSELRGNVELSGTLLL